MMALPKHPVGVNTPQNTSEQLELANQLSCEFHARCFWHSPRDLGITEDMIRFLVKGLRTDSGHRGFKLAAKLQPGKTTLPTRKGGSLGCR
jgi:hypothetical protein